MTTTDSILNIPDIPAAFQEAVRQAVTEFFATAPEHELRAVVLAVLSSNASQVGDPFANRVAELMLTQAAPAAAELTRAMECEHCGRHKIDVRSREDRYQADINDYTGIMIDLCDDCHQVISDEIDAILACPIGDDA